MSCYEWERGTIVVPSAEWAGLKSTIRTAFNTRQRKRHEDAVLLYEAVLKHAKGIRDVNWRIAGDKATKELHDRIPGVWELLSDVFASKGKRVDGRWVDPFSITGSAGRPNKPTKAMFPEAGNRTNRLEVDHGSIGFDDAKRTLEWDVREGNHAIEDAYRDPVTIAMLRALATVKWTARSGGVFYSANEYDRDAGMESPGAGGSRITRRFGKAEEEHRKELASFGRRSGPSPRPSGGAFSSFGGRAWG